MSFRHSILLAALTSLVSLTGVAAAEEKPAAAAQAYTLVYLKSGPQSGKLPEAETKTAFVGHFTNMQRLATERKLVVAGPFGKVRHDESLRGIFVLATAKSEEAQAWAGTDPTTQAGIFVLEYHPIATAFPFLAALEKHEARDAKASEEKRELKLEETMRGYVLLLAEDGAKARQELAGAPVKTFLMADYDGKGLLALLDATSAAEVKEKLGEILARIGSYQLDEWYATNMLATF